GNVVVKQFWKKSALGSAFALNKTLHLDVPKCDRTLSNYCVRFYTAWVGNRRLYCIPALSLSGPWRQ
ncbi:MAG: hypothetical protein Q8L71_08285, partial [Thiobacillus sp.]|nr:hypothetical protein [Thiobacillus sp.]